MRYITEYALYLGVTGSHDQTPDFGYLSDDIEKKKTIAIASSAVPNYLDSPIRSGCKSNKNNGYNHHPLCCARRSSPSP